MRQVAFGVFWIFVFVVAALPASLAVAGWGLNRADYIERSKEAATIAGPLLTFLGFVVAAFVAYSTWLSPFDVTVQYRPFIWRIGPGTPPPGDFNVVSYLTLFNRGATPGVVSDFLMEVEFSKGKWLLEPYFFAKPGEFFQSVYAPEVKVPFDTSLVEGPFTPIYLPGRTQVSKAVSFSRGLGAADFDSKLFEGGTHPIRIYARYNMAQHLTKVMEGTIIFDDGAIADMRAGKTVAGEVRPGDRPIRDLPRQ